MSERWIKCGLPFGPIYKRNSLDHKDSFTERGLAQAGVLIDTKEGIFLLGHINQLGGVCDDCKVFEPETIVRKYKVVWQKSKGG